MATPIIPPLTLSGSKLELAEVCLASAVFEGVETVDAFTELGHVKHAFYFNALEHGRESALKLAPAKHREALEAIDLEKLPAGQPGRWKGEVTFALDVVTGRARELGVNLGRAYFEAGLMPTEIPGTIDWLGMNVPREAMIVVDAKSGFTRVTQAKLNLQLLFAAVGATDVYGRGDALGAIAYTRDDENPYFDTAEWSAFELETARQRIMKLGQRVIRARQAWYAHDPVTGEVNVRPRMVVGEHCRWCPAQMTCPAQGGLVRRLVASPTETEADFAKGLSENAVADLVFRRLVAAKQVIESALARVYARAARVPIRLSTGEVLGEVETETEKLDVEVVEAVVRELHGEAAVIRAVEAKATKASIKRLARQLKAESGGTITEREEKILKVVRERGGVKVTRGKSVKVHKPALPEGETS